MTDKDVDMNSLENNEELVEQSEEEKNTGAKFPLARVRKIMKADPELSYASQDAVFVVAKATVSIYLHLVHFLSIICSLFKHVS